ncbi:glycosyl-hydrolase 97 N-terminal [Bacteroidales bacterium 6E]|nr:glycosyl-hydrolase 97 N-terminal [Bacteroidales bacterium 6E]
MKSLFFVLLIGLSLQLFGKEYKLSSPDKNLFVEVKVDGKISWDVTLNGQPVFADNDISMVFSSGETIGRSPNVIDWDVTSVDQNLFPEVPRRKSVLRDNYNQLTLKMESDYSVVFRAYDYGVAYRFEINRKDSVYILQEQVDLNFSTNATCWFPEEVEMVSHNERLYIKTDIESIDSNRFCSLPVLFEDHSGTKILFTEADLFDYPNLYLFGGKGTSFRGDFPKVVMEVQIPETGGDRDEIISKEADYIAGTVGSRSFPWRVFYITNQMADLFEYDLVYQLSRKSNLDDTDWIKPGKVAWDWWNANNIRNVNFKSGINTETYKYYIDFASRFGLEYIILDEGWSKSTTEIKESSSEIDLVELVNYANERNVGVILWVLWKPLDQDMQSILDTYQSWGIKGIKVDFMQRNDQYMVNYYERVATETAKRKMLVNFHGAFKPAGLQSYYPNFITNEGLRGLEYCKWSENITPGHNVTLPFIRMVAGPMDFTPGAMINAQPDNFFHRFNRPMSMGTRCHQIAMYVIYESPLQMLSDSPSNYYREEESADFISKIPVIWDDTRFLQGKTGEYIAIARKKDDTWYIGVLNNEESRQIELDISFLEGDRYFAEIMQDGVNADRHAEDYAKISRIIDTKHKLQIDLANGGGFAAVLKKM